MNRNKTKCQKKKKKKKKKTAVLIREKRKQEVSNQLNETEYMLGMTCSHLTFFPVHVLQRDSITDCIYFVVLRNAGHKEILMSFSTKTSALGSNKNMSYSISNPWHFIVLDQN